ncbi:glycoside hydrolase family 25 protein [Paenibacillus spongiae]|uniref:Glycoside hydrolase family 25 protein n=1 Tax=Paenibacillus spongiae TaxID=2909671 RepID=A0ABY5S7E8_9BACL|nr:glycoside hydrolase family 25 protein [Paenibacillus spongiae]UVI29510.1 glycoside hydrolase family 25 protein [Paenibacillus spongiae]
MQAKRTSNIKGIDVSRWQGDIDWTKVKADQIRFAWIKATEGTSIVDHRFETNAVEAVDAGLITGFYHYAHPELNTPIAEAAHFAETVNRFEVNLPHVLDIEGEAATLGPAAVTAWAAEWLEEVRLRTGHPVMIYTGAYFAKTYLGKRLAGYPLWVANYGVNIPMGNSTWSSWSSFQYSDSGKVDGICGNVDLNVMEQSFYAKYSIVLQSGEPADSIKVILNHDKTVYGRSINGHVYVPMRKLGNIIGIHVAWDNMRKAPLWDGKFVDEYFMLDHTVYISARSAAALLGGTASWNAGFREVSVRY